VSEVELLFIPLRLTRPYMSEYTIIILKNEMFSSFDWSDYCQFLPFTPPVWFSIVPGTLERSHACISLRCLWKSYLRKPSLGTSIVNTRYNLYGLHTTHHTVCSTVSAAMFVI